MKPRTLAALALATAAAALAAACSGPPMQSTVKDEPICPDFTLGAAGTKMRGGLRKPVRLTVLDGKTPIVRALFLGKRTQADPTPRVMIEDGNDKYTIEWAQCENERASVPTEGGRDRNREGTAFECGEAKVYKTEELVTKKGDAASHELTFPAPPEPACWKDETPCEPVAVADAGAPDAEAPDAGVDDAATAAPTDAATDAATDDSASTDAGPATDAGAAKADAKKPDDKKPAEKKADDKKPGDKPAP